MTLFLKIWTLFIGMGAVVGTAMMWIDPSGTMWGMAPLLETLRARMPWPEVFFNDFIVSGVVLLIVNGLTQFAAAFLLFQKHRLAPYSTLACGIVLMIWIALEWWLFGFNAMSNIYFVFGMIETAVSIIYIKKQKYNHGTKVLSELRNAAHK